MGRFLICLALLASISPGVLPEAATPAPAPSASLTGPAALQSGPAAAAEARADPVAEDPAGEEPPEGYYAFVESPNATPPRVRGPPYRQVSSDCAGAGAGAGAGGAAGGEVRPHVTANNLCGDLNRGLIPRNPMGQNPTGEPYPFELIRNHTLRFLSRTLPVLRADDTLPRVAHLAHAPAPPAHTPAFETHNQLEERSKRSVSDSVSDEEQSSPSHLLPVEHRGASASETPRESRKFCDGGGV